MKHTKTTILNTNAPGVEIQGGDAHTKLTFPSAPPDIKTSPLGA